MAEIDKNCPPQITMNVIDDRGNELLVVRKL